MAVNLLEEDRLVYHDEDGNTFEAQQGLHKTYLDRPYLTFTTIEQNVGMPVNVDRDAVQTLRDALTCWLETGRLTR